MATRIGVLYLGRLVEVSEGKSLFTNPQHPYTKMLLDAVPDLEMSGRARKQVEGEIPNPIDPPSGCAFHPRCKLVHDRCKMEMPELKWLVSLQSPTDDERVNSIDIVPEFISNAEADEHTQLIKVFDLAGQEKKLVISTQGVIELGQILATSAAKLEK